MKKKCVNKNHDHSQDISAPIQNQHYESRTGLVVIITAITMGLEIGYGYYTNSMSLLADGWHMSSHVFALGLAWLAYVITRKYATNEHITFNKEKFLALTGFSSAITLQVMAVIMVTESVNRLLNPKDILFNDAIIVAIIGFLVNGISAFILHHDHDHADHNIRAAYLHVLADGITSLAAIVALIFGLFFNLKFLDAIGGILSGLFITHWAITLMRNSGKVLVEWARREELNSSSMINASAGKRTAKRKHRT